MLQLKTDVPIHKQLVLKGAEYQTTHILIYSQSTCCPKMRDAFKEAKEANTTTTTIPYTHTEMVLLQVNLMYFF